MIVRRLLAVSSLGFALAAPVLAQEATVEVREAPRATLRSVGIDRLSAEAWSFADRLPQAAPTLRLARSGH